MNILSRRSGTMAVLLTFFLSSSVPSAIIEMGNLNIIDDPGNPSDGLRFLELSFSDGLSLTDALTNAQMTYSNAHLARPMICSTHRVYLFLARIT